MVNLYSTNKVEKAIKLLLPNEEDRKICLSLFLEAVNKANSFSSNKWSTHYRSDGIRLVVGHHIVFTVHKDGIWLALDKQMLNEEKDKRIKLENLVETRTWRWDNKDYPEYDKPPSKNGWYDISKRDSDSWHIIKDFHFEFIGKSTTSCQNFKSASQKKHSKELLVYLEHYLGQSVPSSDYNVDQNTKIHKNNEKYKRPDKKSSVIFEPYLDKVSESTKIEIKDVPVRNLKEINLEETEEKENQREKQLITYLRNDEAQEKANGLHQKTLVTLAKYFQNQELTPKESVIDLLVENQNKIFIFEVKSIHTDNFTYQTRSAIGQLLEYEYFEVKSESHFKDMEIHKGVVYSKEPPKEFIEFLEACNLGVYWVNNNAIDGSKESMKTLMNFVHL